MVDVSKLGQFEGLNPWWATGEVPSNLCGLEREVYVKSIERYFQREEIELVSGIRRAGKTTLLYQVISHLIKEKKISPRNILLVNCDEVGVKESFSTILDIISTFNSSVDGKKYVFLDEVQYFENWEQQLKNAFDRYRGNVKLIVSGSSAVLSRSKELYFLTGRFIPLEVYPFSFKEFLAVKGIQVQISESMDEMFKLNASLDLDKHLQQYLAFGGFPQVVLESDVDEKFKTAKLYLETILFKDILKMWEVKDVASLENICRFGLQHLGQRFSYRKISNALGINFNTTQNYSEYLSNSFLLHFVEFYAKSSSQQIKKEKKIFATDNVLHSCFYGYNDIGLLAENAVFVHLLRNAYRVNYWKNSSEVDFIATRGNAVLPVEVKYQEQIKKSDYKGLISFLKHFELNTALLVTKNSFGTETIQDYKIKLAPLWLYLLT